MNKEHIRSELLRLRPDLDIRIDQCDIVRAYSGKLLIGIEHRATAGHFRAAATKLDTELDFQTQVLEEVTAEDESGIVEKVVALLDRHLPSKPTHDSASSPHSLDTCPPCTII
jgi:hypothetical protein